MAAISPAAAWKRFATPVERAIAKATGRISDDLAAEVFQRARRDGYVVTAAPKPKRRRRGR